MLKSGKTKVAIFYSVLVSIFSVIVLTFVVVAVINSIELTSPTGGEFLSGTIGITWDADGETNDTVEVAYSSNGGGSWTALESLIPFDSSYNWNTKEGDNAVPDGVNYQVRVTDSDSLMNDLSIDVFTIDNTGPGEATDISSTSHTIGVWSSDDTVDVIWTDVVDEISGLDGYSILWDTSSDTLPDESKNVGEGVGEDTSPELGHGNSSYFHIRSVDNSGNWGNASAPLGGLGPFWIDTMSPTTTDNAPDGWQNMNVTVDLTPIDLGSGVEENTYYCVDLIDDCTPGTPGTSVFVSTDGENHVRYLSIDKVGNEEEIKSVIVQIDKTAPNSSVLALSEFQNTPGFEIDYTADDGDLSGVATVELFYRKGGGKLVIF